MTRPDMRVLATRSWGERMRMHHDPIFVGRLLDQKWLMASDVVAIAARRPSTPAVVLAVAVRDRWLCMPSVREAIAENPYAPPPLARLLAPRRDPVTSLADRR
jgi:hypothetical protein